MLLQYVQVPFGSESCGLPWFCVEVDDHDFHAGAAFQYIGDAGHEEVGYDVGEPGAGA